MSIEVCFSPYGYNLYFICWKDQIKNKHISSVANIYFLHDLSFVRIEPISNVQIIKKGAYLKFAMGAIFHRYATGHMNFILDSATTPSASDFSQKIFIGSKFKKFNPNFSNNL